MQLDTEEDDKGDLWRTRPTVDNPRYEAAFVVVLVDDEELDSDLREDLLELDSVDFVVVLSLEPPSLEPLSLDPPSLEAPSLEAPSLEAPSFDPPSFGPPSLDSEEELEMLVLVSLRESLR